MGIDKLNPVVHLSTTGDAVLHVLLMCDAKRGVSTVNVILIKYLFILGNVILLILIEKAKN